MTATLDVISRDEAKRAIRLSTSNTSFDTAIDALITGVSLALDKLCGPIVVRTITGEVHDGGNRSIILNYKPVSSITTVTEYNGTTATTLTAQTNTSQGPSNYLADLTTGILRRRSSNYADRFAAGAGNIVVTYIAGRYATTATVAEDFKQAAGVTFAHWWRPEQGFASLDPDGAPLAGIAIPNAALKFLGLDLRKDNSVMVG